MVKKLLAFLRLGRVGMSPLTMSVPVLGAFSAGESPPQLLPLMLIGLNAHFFGFGLNDLIDAPIDRKAPYRQRHPLTTGRLQHGEAWVFVLLQIPLALALYSRFHAKAGLITLMISMALSVIYNRFSKRGLFSRVGAEMALAASVGLLCFAGALTQTETPLLASSLFALILSLILLLLNSVPSGLKDLKTDTEAGASSFVIVMGCTMLDDDQYRLPARLRWYSGLLQLAIMAGIGGLLYLFRPPSLLSLLIIVLTLYGGLHLRMLLSLTSFRLLRASLSLLNGFYNYVALALILVDKMPTGLQILYGLLVIGVISVPLRLSFALWRTSRVIR